MVGSNKPPGLDKHDITIVEENVVMCTLKDEHYNGNCEGCNNREFCMLSEMIEKIRNLEAIVTQLQAKLTV